MIDKKLTKTKIKESVQPNWEESDFAKTIDGQIMIMLKKAIESKHYIEAHTLSWSSIEQLLLPRLIGWVAKILKINLPKKVYNINSQGINFLYLCISHDEKLYKKLEACRKQRNKIIHEITNLGNEKAINKLAKTGTLNCLELEQEIIKRFDGKVLIPSINLYKNGWNDALDKMTYELLGSEN